MTGNPLQLTPVALAAAHNAGAQFQFAAAASPSGYKLLYLTSRGCGSVHDYSKLLQARGLGLELFYINSTAPGEAFTERDAASRAAPGNPIVLGKGMPRGEQTKQMRKFLTDRVDGKLEFYDYSKAVLLAPDGHVVHVFQTTKSPNFIQELKSYLPQRRAETEMTLPPFEKRGAALA